MARGYKGKRTDYFHEGIILLIGVAFGLLMFWTMLAIQPLSVTVKTAKHQAATTTVSAVSVSTSSEPIPGEPSQNTELPADNTTATLDVVWHAPVKRDVVGIYAGLAAVTSKMYGAGAPVQADIIGLGNTDIEEVGTVTTGTYKDSKVLVLQFVEEEDIGGEGISYHVLLLSPDGSELRILPRYDWGLTFGGPPSILISAPNLRISDLEVAPTLTLENGKKLVSEAQRDAYPAYPFFEAWGAVKDGLQKMAKTKDGLDVWGKAKRDFGQYMDGVLYIFKPDGEPIPYQSLIPFDPKNGDVQVRWQSSSTSTNYSPYIQDGCGIHNSSDILTDAQVGSPSSIVVGGQASEGDPIYLLKDPLKYDVLEQTWLYTQNQLAEFGSAGVNTSTAAFQDYVSKNPNAIFFWKDALGRWVQYVKSDLEPENGGCG